MLGSYANMVSRLPAVGFYKRQPGIDHVKCAVIHSFLSYISIQRIVVETEEGWHDLANERLLLKRKMRKIRP
jgi:hypothetical protein